MQFNFSKIKHSRIYLLIIITTFIIYGNGINNEYSLDDNIIVDKYDSIVERGLKAIPRIFKSRYANDKEQSYDYRPITTVSFAVEKQFFRKLTPFQTKKEKQRKDKLTQANISHFINVLLYAITCILIFQVLSTILEDYHVLLPLLITFIFLVHPVHTEVVDNIKSRDELLMFLFMLLAIKQYFKFEVTSKYKYLIFATIFVLLSTLSKKNGLAIIGVLPVLLYFKGYNWKRMVYPLLTLIVVIAAIKFMKKGLVSGESYRNLRFFENPLIESNNFMDRITVGLYSALFYLKLLIFPKDLAYYYGYNQIPMATWKYWQVWLSLFIFVPLGIYGFIQFLKRNVIGLGIVLWYGLMIAVINVLFPIVGIVADRFAYTFSFGFCIVIGFLLFKVFKVNIAKEQLKINIPNSFAITILSLLFLFSVRTIVRNPDWHDYLHLYVHDVDVVDESAKAHSLISNTLYPLIAKNPQDPKNPQYIQDIVFHYKRALEIDSTYLTCYCNLGSAYIDMVHDYEKGIYYSNKAVTMDSNYLEATLNLAVGYERINKLDSALKYYARGIEIDPERLMSYNILNRFVAKYGKVEQGIERLKEIAGEAENPKFTYTNIGNLYSLDQSTMDSALVYFEKAFNLDKTDQKLCGHIKMLYSMKGNTEKVNFYTQYCN